MIIKINKDVNLEINENNIGVLVSGGADSAILLYFLLKYTKNHLHIFTLSNKSKPIYNVKSSIDVIQKCAELTNNFNFTHHIKYDIYQDRINLFMLPKAYLEKNEIDCVYTGITKNPPGEITTSFYDKTTEDDERNPQQIRKTIKGNFYAPWTNLNKKDLFEIYKKYNLLDNLFPLTRSCESHDVLNSNHCGMCWWCQERLWGFERLI